MSTQLLSQFVGWFSLPVLVVLAGVLVWRKIPREYPHFFNYIVINALVGLARLWAYRAGTQAYLRVYWISDVLISVFAVLATYELFVKRLFPRFYAVRFYQFLFPAAATVITLFAVPAALQTRNISIVLLIIHVLDVLRVTMLLFFVALMVFMGRQWDRYELGVAMGLVVEASGLLISSAVWTQKPFVRHLLDQLPVITYDAACVIWLITFLHTERKGSVGSQLISTELLHDARKWEETLKGSVTGKKPPE